LFLKIFKDLQIFKNTVELGFVLEALSPAE
jgi:hypothetical protein